MERERCWLDGRKVEGCEAHGSFGRVLVVERVRSERSERPDAMTARWLREDGTPIGLRSVQTEYLCHTGSPTEHHDRKESPLIISTRFLLDNTNIIGQNIPHTELGLLSRYCIYSTS